MVYRRKRRRYARRRSRFRRRRVGRVGRVRGRRRVRVRRRLPAFAGGVPYPRTVAGMWPSRYRTKLRFVVCRSLDPAAGSYAVHQFALASVYDPDITSVGHQPQGYDLITPHYSKYHVLGVKWKCLAYTTDNSTGAPMAVGSRVTQDTTFGTFGSLNAMLENYQFRNVRTVAANPGNQAKCYIRGSVNLAKVTGLPWNNVLRSADVTDNPAISPTLNLFVFPADLASNVGTVFLLVTLDYDVIFSERKPLLTES